MGDGSDHDCRSRRDVCDRVKELRIRADTNGHERRRGSMKISDWLDENVAEGSDMSRIVMPNDLSYDEAPDETVFFEEIRPCGILCTGNHPSSTVERFGHWYYCRGQDKKAGIHTSGMEWRLFTKDKDLAVKTAKSHME
jgi:hypothetical protein